MCIAAVLPQQQTTKKSTQLQSLILAPRAATTQTDRATARLRLSSTSGTQHLQTALLQVGKTCTTRTKGQSSWDHRHPSRRLPSHGRSKQQATTRTSTSTGHPGVPWTARLPRTTKARGKRRTARRRQQWSMVVGIEQADKALYDRPGANKTCLRMNRLYYPS